MAFLLLLFANMIPSSCPETTLMTSDSPELPQSLWDHPLFAKSAFFTTPSPWFSASTLDYRIRKLRNMPSSSDESVDAALAGVEHVLFLTRQWLEKSAAPSSVTCRTHLKRAETIRKILQSNTVSRDMAGRMAQRVIQDIAGVTHVQALVTNREFDKGPDTRLDAAISCLLDFAMLSDPALKPRYLKRLHRAIDAALEYNATSGGDRNRNVILWLRLMLEAEKRRGLSYVDVGCSVKTGATDTILAADILRPGGLCLEVHGTDIVPPQAGLVDRMFNRHRIRLYQADPVLRPLHRRYDAIMLANVHRHLDSELQRRLIGNLACSLEENGRLIVNWRFDAARSPCMCLQRHGRIVVKTAEINAARDIRSVHPSRLPGTGSPAMTAAGRHA